MGSRGRAGLLLFLAVCVIAANMRTTITGLGPLLEQISADVGTSLSVLGVLASVPLIAWALISPVANDLSRRFGLTRVMMWALVLLLLGTVVRSLPGVTANLWLGTGIIGVALALMNVMMPAVIRRDFPMRIPQMTGLYSALLAGVGALMAGLVVPISHIEIGGRPVGWRVALLSMGALLPLAIVLWGAWQRRYDRPRDRPAVAPRTKTRIWSDPVAWQIALYMGTQSAGFYILVTWIAPMSTSFGLSETAGGLNVMTYQMVGLLGSLGLPYLLRGSLRRWTPMLLPALATVGALGLIFLPEFIVAWALLCGLTAGSSLTMSLTLMAERAVDFKVAVSLSGMSQSVGYVLSALGAASFGWIYEAVGNWTVPLLLYLAIQFLQGGVGYAVGRERMVQAT